MKTSPRENLSVNFPANGNTNGKLNSESYDPIMNTMAEKEFTSSVKKLTTSRSRTDNPNGTDIYQDEFDMENSEEFNELHNVSSNELFVLDHVGNKNLKLNSEVKDESDGDPKEEISSDDDDDEDGTMPSWTFGRPENKKTEKTKLSKKGKDKKDANPQYTLSTSIETHLDKLLAKKYKTDINKLLDKVKPAPDPASEILTERQKKKRNKKHRDQVCSSKWFNMKAPELTKDVKNQLSILRLREILDRKNFYKSNDRQKFPKFFQMGKVVESSADFYHARIPKKQRKATLLDEVMADADLKRYQKRKYAEIFGEDRKSVV